MQRAHLSAYSFENNSLIIVLPKDMTNSQMLSYFSGKSISFFSLEILGQHHRDEPFPSRDQAWDVLATIALPQVV